MWYRIRPHCIYRYSSNLRSDPGQAAELEFDFRKPAVKLKKCWYCTFSHINIFISEKDLSILFYRLFFFKFFFHLNVHLTELWFYKRYSCWYTVFMFIFYCYLNSWAFIHEPAKKPVYYLFIWFETVQLK